MKTTLLYLTLLGSSLLSSAALANGGIGRSAAWLTRTAAKLDNLIPSVLLTNPSVRARLFPGARLNRGGQSLSWDRTVSWLRDYPAGSRYKESRMTVTLSQQLINNKKVVTFSIRSREMSNEFGEKLYTATSELEETLNYYGARKSAQWRNPNGKLENAHYTATSQLEVIHISFSERAMARMDADDLARIKQHIDNIDLPSN